MNAARAERTRVFTNLSNANEPREIRPVERELVIYCKDWGTGQPVVFSHGWPLSADAWEDQMVFLADRGYRCIAHDRRDHGRSSQPQNPLTYLLLIKAAS